jgi:hypothetical protein
MTQAFDFIGGSSAGIRAIDGIPPAVQTFSRNPVEGQSTPADVAAYRLEESTGTPQYHFVGRRNKTDASQ